MSDHIRPLTRTLIRTLLLIPIASATLLIVVPAGCGLMMLPSIASMAYLEIGDVAGVVLLIGVPIVTGGAILWAAIHARRRLVSPPLVVATPPSAAPEMAEGADAPADTGGPEA